MKRNIILILPLLTLAACAPKVEERHFQGAKTDFKPHYEDTDLRGLNSKDDKFKGNIQFSGGYSNGSLYRFSDNLSFLGKSLNRPQLQTLGFQLKAKLQDSSQTKIRSENSPYVEFLISKAKPAVREALSKLDLDLAKGQEDLVGLIKDFNSKFSLEAPPVDINSGIAYIKQYLNELNNQITEMPIMPELKSGIQSELQAKLSEIDGLNEKAQKILTDEGTFPTMLDNLFAFMQEQKIELPQDIQPMIDQAKVVSADLLACKTPQDGLTVIVDVWLLLDEQDRKTYFEEISPALYKELKKSGPKALNCLRDDHCKNFIRNLKKDLFILPELKKFGVEKICHEIDINAQVFVKSLLQTEITKILVKAPDMIPGEVESAIAKKREELKTISDNFSEVFKDKFSQWAEKNNLTRISIDPVGRQEVDISGNKITLEESDSSGLDMFDALGPSVAVSVQEANLKSAFESINRMAQLSDIVMNDENVHGKKVSKEFRNSNQAETIRGLSQLIRFLRDWEKSDFDETLGKVTAQDLISDISLGENNRSLFPKADLYALAISTTAQFIKDLQSENSPIFTIDVNKEIKWQGSKDSSVSGEDQPSAIAGIVEINDGKRSRFAKTQHVARWILAVSEFVSALEDVEKSSSVDLQQPGADGKVPMDELRDARNTLRQLVMGLSNFLSHQMIDERGLFASSLDLQTIKLSATSEVSILDQALAIRALLTASDALGMDIYRLSAVDGYYKMNLQLFHAKQRFYQNSRADINVQLPVVLEMLRTMSALEPYLPEKSAEQLRWIMQPWLEGLEKLSL